MLEMTKTVLQRVSFDKTLFRKELVKATKWLEGDEVTKLKVWCLATFGTIYGDVIGDVFKTTASIV